MGQAEYALPVDIWSSGCIIAEMGCGAALFMGDCEIDTIFKIFQKLGTPSFAEWPELERLRDFKAVFLLFVWSCDSIVVFWCIDMRIGYFNTFWPRVLMDILKQIQFRTRFLNGGESLGLIFVILDVKLVTSAAIYWVISWHTTLLIESMHKDLCNTIFLNKHKSTALGIYGITNRITVTQI